jgi:hypothetical protein
MGRLIITAPQLKSLKENLMSEGVWDIVKNQISRLTNKGAHVDPRESDEIKAIIDKGGNEIIKKLDDEIKTQNPDFPNNQNTSDFLLTVMSIAAVYDSLLIAATKQPNVQGYLPVDIANGIINDLKEYVRLIRDRELSATYKKLNEDNSDVARQQLQAKSSNVNVQSLLEPLGVTIVTTGKISTVLKSIGVGGSRKTTLDSLYSSIQNLNSNLSIFQRPEPPNTTPEIDPETEPNPDVTRGTQPTTPSVSTDDIYNSIKGLFKFIVSNRKMFGIRAASDIPTKDSGNYFHPMKNGDKVFYNGKPVTIVNTQTGTPNKTLVQYPNNTKMAVDSNKLHKLKESVIREGQYIRNKQVLTAISKGITDDKLKSFEEFMNRLEQVRNKIRNLKPTGDKVLDGWVKKIKSNPLIATNFQKIFSIDPNNKNVISTLISFINKLFATVYGGNFKNGQLMDKISEADVPTDPTAFAKLAQDRGKFNQNVITFLSDAIGFYQYLSKARAANATAAK